MIETSGEVVTVPVLEEKSLDVSYARSNIKKKAPKKLNYLLTLTEVLK